jgi:hypothetical protein
MAMKVDLHLACIPRDNSIIIFFFSDLPATIQAYAHQNMSSYLNKLIASRFEDLSHDASCTTSRQACTIAALYRIEEQELAM